MNVLIACEESQRVCMAFRAKGHNAFSCDIIEPSGGHPEWHILGDVLKILGGGTIVTMDGTTYDIGKWDMIIAHPPCTYLSNAGARHLYRGGNGVINEERLRKGIKASHFFLQLLWADCKKIVVENPIPSSVYMLPPYSQIIEPWMFGHPFKKKTCLWIKGVKKLQPTNICEIKESTKIAGNWYNKGGKDRQKNRAKTFSGIAAAMAEQWG